MWECPGEVFCLEATQEPGILEGPCRNALSACQMTAVFEALEALFTKPPYSGLKKFIEELQGQGML